MRSTAAAGEMVRLGTPAVVIVCGIVGTETRMGQKAGISTASVGSPLLSIDSDGRARHDSRSGIGVRMR